jgi:hypothetical protein
VSFPLPPIKDEALQKFCAEHELYEAIAAGYHYAQKFFPQAKKISLRFHEPYYADEPEDADVIFDIESGMKSSEVLDARDKFVQAMDDIPGAFYLVISHRFVKHESS